MFRKPLFDKDGNWHLPKNIKFGGQMNPKLKPTEWLLYILLNSKNPPKEIFKTLIGSRSTIWRTKKSLEKKGYL